MKMFIATHWWVRHSETLAHEVHSHQSTTMCVIVYFSLSHSSTCREAALHVTDCAEHISASTRPHQLCWSDWEMGNTCMNSQWTISP